MFREQKSFSTLKIDQMHFNKIQYKRDYYQPHKIIQHVLIYLNRRKIKLLNRKKWISNHLFYISAALARLWWVTKILEFSFVTKASDWIIGLRVGSQSDWSNLYLEPGLNIFKGFNVGRTTRHLGNICDREIVPHDLVNLCRRERLRRIRNQRFINHQDRMSSYSLFY